MEQRFAGVVKFRKATAMYIYTRDSGVATIIQDFKYKGFPSLARFMGRTMAEQLLTTGFFNDIDLIIPVVNSCSAMVRPMNRAREGNPLYLKS